MFDMNLEPWEKLTPQFEELAPKIRAISYPIMPEKPVSGQFYRVYPEGCVCGKGTAYHGNVRIGDEAKRLLIYFNGGGFSFDEYTVSRPWNMFTPHIQDTYYSNDAEWIGDFFLLTGISARREDNPFLSMSAIQLPYANGDFHAGNGEFPYTAQDGSKRLMPYHGWKNAISTIELAKGLLPEPEELIIAGSSAGAAGAAMLAEDIIERFPSAKKVTLVLDSMLICSERFAQVLPEVWHSPEHIVRRLRSGNLMLDNILALQERYGERVRALYLCSAKDALLIMAQNAIDGKGQTVNDGDGEVFRKRLADFLLELKQRVPDANYYVFQAPMDAEGYDPELTLHCTLNNPSVFEHREDGLTPAEWIMGCMAGKNKDIGGVYLK